MSNDNHSTSDEIDVTDPNTTKFEIVKEGLRRDGIEILHYEPAFDKPGTPEEKRVERFIAFCFALTGLGALGFVVTYIFWPWEYEYGQAAALSKWYTPMLGLTLGIALAGLGIGILTWAKKLLPKEELVQERHDGGSSIEDRKITGATISNVVDETGVKRRPLLKRALLLGSAPLGLAAIAPLGALIVPPGDARQHTGFDGDKFNHGEPVRLILKDGTPVRPDMVSIGGQVTVYPDIPHGTTNQHADSPTLLIHLRDADAKEARKYIAKEDEKYADAHWNNYFAFSKICTHVGCPASLYEQQTNRLLCPCHQSQFDILQGAKPIFGPATRALPQLPIEVHDDGFFYATSDYLVPVGPAFWEREA